MSIISETKKKFYENSVACIIPHAGKIYAGQARKKIFEILNKREFNNMIYLATVHELTNKSFVGYDDEIFELFSGYPQIEFTSEHSYKFVKDEIKYYFGNIKILVIYPGINEKKLFPDICAFLEKNPKTLVCATTDLTHYGEYYGNLKSIKYPPRLEKLFIEEKLINSLIAPEKKIENPEIMCGENTIKIFIDIKNKLGWKGKVISYYDSVLIDDNSVNVDEIDNFVSYISILYSIENNNFLDDSDIKIGLSMVKNSIIFGKRKFPIWSEFNNMKNGVFVGTLYKNSTNCCYGRYENGQSTAEKIIEAALDCPDDAKYRWGIPYPNDYKNLKYKLEILQEKALWRKYPAKIAPSILNLLNGTMGVYLKLPSGQSATYLPVVARESKMDIETYMNQLSKKAGGNEDDWKKEKSIIWIYGSYEYST
jgi:predicted class III extradiol MEMO1 family dioxygenase